MCALAVRSSVSRGTRAKACQPGMPRALLRKACFRFPPQPCSLEPLFLLPDLPPDFLQGSQHRRLLLLHRRHAALLGHQPAVQLLPPLLLLLRRQRLAVPGAGEGKEGTQDNN